MNKNDDIPTRQKQDAPPSKWLLLIEGTPLADYIQTRNPAFLWSFLFSLMTFTLVIVGIVKIFFLGVFNDLDSPTSMILKYILVGTTTQGLSYICRGHITSFAACLFMFIVTIFIYQLS